MAFKRIIIALISFPCFFLAQQLKIIYPVGIEFPKVTVNQSTIDEVIKLFGNNFTLSEKSYDEYTLSYPSKGISFLYIHSDSSRLIRLITIDSSANAITDSGIEINKSTVADVFRIHKYQVNHQYIGGNISTPLMQFCVKNPLAKVDSSVKITGIRIFSENNYNGISKANYIFRETPKIDARKFIDSVFRIAGLTEKQFRKIYEEKEFPENCYKIELREFDSLQNDFGVKQMYGDFQAKGFWGAGILFNIGSKNGKIIYVVQDENIIDQEEQFKPVYKRKIEHTERKLIVQDKEEFDRLSAAYKEKFGIKMDLQNPNILETRKYSFGYYGDDFDIFLRKPVGTGASKEGDNKKVLSSTIADSLYALYSLELRSLEPSKQAYGVYGLYFLNRNGKKIRKEEKILISNLKKSNKEMSIGYHRGCYGYRKVIGARKLIRLMKNRKRLPQKWKNSRW